VNRTKQQIKEIASQYGLQIIYAFGSRANEALDLVEDRIEHLASASSDLDIGVKPEKPLTVEEKVKIAILFEDLFDVPRVDLIVLPEAPISLAFEIVTGEILYMQDSTHEAEYQLYIMRLAADLLPYERMREEMIMGKHGDPEDGKIRERNEATKEWIK
jgi:predicted nucleotidyltransferase